MPNPIANLLSTPANVDFRTQLGELTSGLRSRAVRLCRDPVEADDIVQDTVVRALRFQQSYRPGTNMRAWVHQILFSVFVTRCRKLKRERNALSSLTVDPCAWTHRDTPPPMQSLSPNVENAVERLPKQFGAVVRLVDLDDHSYREAADVLGVPVGTVMSRLFRGRRLLAHALQEAA